MRDQHSGPQVLVHELRTDPVCGMSVTTESAAAATEWDGRLYWFCSEGCRRDFDKDPGRFRRRDQ